MLRISADINGQRIGWLFIHNTSRHNRGFWYYDAATWDEGKQEGVFGIEGVRHDRSRPWTDLVALVLRELPR